ncbi:RnfH family protein [Pseudomonas donghuensis]|uniref:RnfH family protein n=1 Tax=Pseudomonas donghuensis TaxID=1163398 RepID=UPI000C2A835D|nr:RnfH family protein [Pseudomonas donghuensis]MCP6699849.1 RnfH family protein [Pseudomonas donghuensis]PJY95393.1 RnfH family protein [Pseudomonas donghuensis]UVL28830.1 RnfH family protein [Pseudomonas donghuensis]WKY27708.1 RnfH family protein [Pseudomonas donghuensis]
MSEALLTVEVVYAVAERQVLLSVEVPTGTTINEAVKLSEIAAHFPEANVQARAVGIFGRVIGNPEEHKVEAGDRIELYRPLLADPKEVRKQRAAKVARVFKKAKR